MMKHMEIQALATVTPSVRDDINELIGQLTSRSKSYTLLELDDIVKDKHYTILAAQENDHIIGMGFLLVFRKSLGLYAIIEDVVVHSDHRGKGIGKALMEGLIAQAQKKGVAHIDLTSRPQRKEANTFYQNLGFEKRNTNVYRLTL
jgi:ribosomal protein S18 acetylase RimI-like enzyme